MTTTADLIAEARRSQPQGGCADRLADALVAYHAKVRDWAIQPWLRAMTAGKWWSCRMCGAGWEGSTERHKSDCPARPMEDAGVVYHRLPEGEL